MGIASTYYVTREFAIAAIKRKQETDKSRIKGYRKVLNNNKKLKHCKDEELETILEVAIHNGFYNFSIVSAEHLKAIRANQYFILDDLDNLPPYNDAE